MLNFIFGRSGYGKTQFVFDKIEQQIKTGQGDIILMSPEQFSFISEYRLLEALGESKVGKVQCLSFSRLCNEIERLYGGGSLPVLTKGGKVVLMKKAIDSVQADLTLFGKKTSSSAFVSSMIQIYDEMKSCNLSGEEICSAAENLDRDVLSNKLSDFSKIMSAYDALLANRFADPAEHLSRLYQKLLGLGYFQGKTVYIDGFNGFVAQEYKILEIVIEEAEAVYIALDTDSFGSRNAYDLFAYVNETASILKKIADKRGVPVTVMQLTENHRAQSADLKCVEANLFSTECPAAVPEAQNIRIYSASTITDACEDTARQIKKLLRAGYKASDIAVTMRDKNKYAALLASAFEKYEVPYFADERQPIAAQPIIVFTLYLLRCICFSLQSSDIFSLIKTGLTDVSADEDLYLTENYVFTWKVNGSDWKKEFEKSPQGFAEALTERDKKELEQINHVRSAVIPLLLQLQKRIKKATPKQISAALFETIKSFHADLHLRTLAEFLHNHQASALAQEQAKTWDILMEILNQIAVTLPEELMPVREYYDLFVLIVQTEDLGEIPVGLDNIQVGQADRIRFNNPRAVFILGANEGEFPQAVSGGGLLTESERKILADHDFKLYSFGEILNLQERYFAYKACSAPSEKLFVSYLGNTGKETAPSVIVSGLQELFPQMDICKLDYTKGFDLLDTRRAAFELMANQYHNSDTFYNTLKKYFASDARYLAVKQIAQNEDVHINNRDTAAQLFHKDMQVSASRIEDYYNCPYRYFCKFGLGARPRMRAEINPMERGTLIHYVLEQILSQVGSKALSQYSREQIRTLVDTRINEYFTLKMGNPQDVSERFTYNFRRLSKMIVDVVCRLASEFSVCDFEAKAFELPIGETGAVKPTVIELENGGSLRIRGSIDRVDVLKKDGQQYVRIVDYKSGAKAFKLCDIVHGLNLQMFVYLFNLCRDTDCSLSGIPAGVLYMHSARAVLSVDHKQNIQQQMQKQEDDSFRMNGIIFTNDDDSVVQAMEHDLAGKYIPVSLTRKGDLAGSLATFEELGLLEEKINGLVAEMGNALLSGRIAQHPVQSKTHNKTCDYCDYASVCSMKKGITPRCFEEERDDAVLAALRKEGESDA